MTAEQPRAEPDPADRRYGVYERRAAVRLQRHNPGWLVQWGPWSRKFYAFPGFSVPPGTIVTARTPGRLLDRMRETEARAGHPPRRMYRLNRLSLHRLTRKGDDRG